MTAPAPAPMGPLARRRLGLPTPEPEKPPEPVRVPEWIERRARFGLPAKELLP